MARVTKTALSTAAVVCLLAACGSDTADDAPEPGEMDMSAMNDPDATPADEVDGEVTSGDFTVLDTAPPGSDDVAGQAWLGQNDDGSTVTVRLTGLEPGTDYVAHLHQQACSQDAGGDHFQFERGGATTPPNEVHLRFTTDDSGAGAATVIHDRRVFGGAPAVVIHPADSMDNRLACADFS